jgi:hypothetical protein
MIVIALNVQIGDEIKSGEFWFTVLRMEYYDNKVKIEFEKCAIEFPILKELEVRRCW